MFSLSCLLLVPLHWRRIFEINIFSISGILNHIFDILASNIENSIFYFANNKTEGNNYNPDNLLNHKFRDNGHLAKEDWNKWINFNLLKVQDLQLLCWTNSQRRYRLWWKGTQHHLTWEILSIGNSDIIFPISFILTVKPMFYKTHEILTACELFPMQIILSTKVL